MSDIPIHCILATDVNNGIASAIGIPWLFKEDIKYFQTITTNTISVNFTINAVIMGRSTYETIPEKFRPLGGRLNIIISTTYTENVVENLTHDLKKPIVFNSPRAAIEWLNMQKKYNIENIFIIGGVRLYNEFVNSNLIDKLYITHILSDYKTTKIINISKSNNYNLIESNQNQYQDLNDPERGLISVAFNVYQNVHYSVSNEEENAYLNMLNKIITTGHYRSTRNAYTYSIFGEHLEFDLVKGFPLLTTKKMFLRGIFEELKFFLLGKTNTKELEKLKINIWKGNTERSFLDANEFSHYIDGEMGPMYGYQWRFYNAEYHGCTHDYTGQGFDQLQEVIDLLIRDRYSRRIVMTSYNPLQAKQGVLYPCHGLCIQFGIHGDNKLCCHMTQRSGDTFLGIPYNIASYALIVHIICNVVNQHITNPNDKLIPGKLVMSFGDVHVYNSHIDAVREQITRKPYGFPQIKINRIISSLNDIENLSFSDIELIDYNCYPSINAQMVA